MFFAAILVAQVSALLRYIVLARILGPEELGLAATLTVTSAFFDMISETGSDRFLIQDRDGDTPAVQGLVQIVYLCRGLLTATALVVSAYPIALFYHSPRLAAGLALLALPSIINGFLHLDVRRVQRDHDFQAQAVVTLVAEVGALVATGVAAWLTHQFTAVIFGLVTRALLATTLSHLQAKRPYRLKWDRAAARRLAHFAAPLTINGFLLFIVSQSDRVIVGNQLGLTALGKYSAMMLLIYYPTTMVSSYLHGIYIPIIAAHRDDLAERGRASDGMGGLTVLLGLAMVVGYAGLAPTIAPAVFGHRFAQPALLVGMVGALQIARFLLSWPTTAALAIGRSRTVLLGNLTHILAIPAAFIGLWTLGGLLGVVAGFFAGEIIAIVVSLALLNRNMGRPPFKGLDRLGEFLIGCAAVLGWNLVINAHSLLGEVAMLAASAAALVWFFGREAVAIGLVWSLLEKRSKTVQRDSHAAS